MNRVRPILGAAIALACAAPAVADEGACELCLGRPNVEDEWPLTIEIESGLHFSRQALRGRGDGEAEIDPQSGEKRVANMIDLGGMAYQGRASITGAPLRPVRIVLPPRVPLRSPDGARAELTDFVTDLPPVAMLDENGRLEFAFGARLSSQDARAGNFRGRINIRVDYF